MKLNKKMAALPFFLMVLMFLPGCSSGEVTRKQEDNLQTEVVERTEELLYAVNVDSSISVVNFQNVWLNRNQFWGGLVFQGLLIADDNVAKVKPDLCEEYIISPDGKKYVFRLKENIYWHDGERLTTEDVVWSLETSMKSAHINGYIQKELKKIEGIGDFQSGKTEHISGISVKGNDITIQLVEKDGNFLASIAQLAILPKHCLEDISVEEIDSAQFWKQPIGSGPYKVEQANDGCEAVLAVNEKYIGQVPKIKKIRYKVLENPQTDEFDFTMTSDTKTVNKFLNDPKYEVKKTNNLYYRYLMFNLDGRSGKRAELLQKKEVRQALLMALDRDKILKNIYGEAAVGVIGGIPKTDSWYLPQTDQDISYNPRKAKQMLLEAEFDFEETVILTRYHQDDLSVRLLEEIAACWNAVGIKTEIVPTNETMTDKIWKDTDWYDVGLKNLSAIDYSEWYYEYSSENQLWSVILNRTEFDDLTKALDTTSMAKEKNQLYKELQKLERELVYKIPVCIIPQYVIYNKEHVEIPEIDFPNMWFYFDCSIADWEMKIQE